VHQFRCVSFPFSFYRDSLVCEFFFSLSAIVAGILLADGRVCVFFSACVFVQSTICRLACFFFLFCDFLTPPPLLSAGPSAAATVLFRQPQAPSVLLSKLTWPRFPSKRMRTPRRRSREMEC
jgi:hypothetical protein